MRFVPKRRSPPSPTENIARVLAECLGYPLMPGNTTREQIDPRTGVVLCVEPMSMVTILGPGSTWGLYIGKGIDGAWFVMLDGEQVPDKVAGALAVADRRLDGLISQVLKEHTLEYTDEDPDYSAVSARLLSRIQQGR